MDFMKCIDLSPLRVEALEILAANGLSLEEAKCATSQICEAMHRYAEGIKHLAGRDGLTGAWNRAYLEDWSNAYLQRHGKAILMMLDVDNFKNLNDTFGHPTGDLALRTLTKALQELFRQEDIIARVGGDEFVVFMPGTDSMELAEEKARIICEDISEKVSSEIQILSGFSVSVGMSSTLCADEFEQLYKLADQALYISKHAGHGQYHFSTVSKTISNKEDTPKEFGISDIRNYIIETRDERGVYNVDFDGFRDIYRFMERTGDRNRIDSELVLFTLDSEKYGEAYTVKLQEALSRSLRRGDVSNCFSDRQFAVLLIGTNHANARRVADRVVQEFVKGLGEVDKVPLRYVLEPVTTRSVAS